MELSGTWKIRAADDDLRRSGIGFDHDDTDWDEIPVPSHWRNHPAYAESDGPFLFRRRFTAPPPVDGQRTFVTLDGVFYQADVWLDGAYLGDPEGYFTPNSFDITSLARLGDDHVLAVEVTCGAHRDQRAKRTITGVFQDEVHAGFNPGGIWRPVRIETTGAVRIDRCRVLCRDANDSRAHLRLRARLDSDAGRSVRIRTSVDGVVTEEHEQSLARGANEVDWNLDVNEPTLWWPWTLGEQSLTDVCVEVVVDGEVSHSRTVRTGLREIGMQDWVMSINGERLFVKGVNLEPTRLALADATPEELRNDIVIARDAGLDLVRVHGHVSRPELYDAADELGVLIWQDMPMRGGYARSVRRQAVQQARDLVDLLGHHPSVVRWCCHDDPEETAARQQLPTWNKTILDRWVKRAFEQADETRPVLAHSGVLPHLPQLDGNDSHLSFGWNRGDERDLPGFAAAVPRMVRFVSRFGAQSVAQSASGFIDIDAWPDLDWESLTERFGLEREPFERHLAPAHAFETFDEWASATQRYQSTLLRHHIETLRRLKYRPTGGFCFSSLADPRPMVSSSVLDHDRRPKSSIGAVIDACRPVIVVADRLPHDLTPGGALALDVHAISDLRRVLESMECTAVLRWAGGSHTWRWRGDIPPDECVRVGTIQFVVPDAPGGLWLDLTLVHGDEVASNRYESVIASRA